MKTLWNMLSFMAMVNLLALLMLGGWLWHSGRLDRDRLLDVREMLSSTITETDEAAAEAQREQDAAAEAQREAERRADPQPSSAARVRQLSRDAEQDRLARQRLAAEREMILGRLDEQLSAMERERASQESGADDARADLDEEAAARSENQMQMAVSTLESLPPKQARRMLGTLLDEGDAAQAVAYLARMKARQRAKVLGEFKDEPDVAMDLLEKLRTLGADLPGERGSSDGTDDTSTG